MACDCGCNREPICQSCRMPMKEKDDFGTNEDGSNNNDYCRFCFHGGKFTDEGITVEQKAEKIAGIMAKMKGTTEEQAKDMAKKYLPQLKELKRWKK